MLRLLRVWGDGSGTCDDGNGTCDDKTWWGLAVRRRVCISGWRTGFILRLFTPVFLPMRGSMLTTGSLVVFLTNSGFLCRRWLCFVCVCMWVVFVALSLIGCGWEPSLVQIGVHPEHPAAGGYSAKILQHRCFQEPPGGTQAPFVTM